MDRPILIHMPTPTVDFHHQFPDGRAHIGHRVERTSLPETLWEVTGGLPGKSGTKLYRDKAHAQNTRRTLVRLAQILASGRDPQVIHKILTQFAQEDASKAGLPQGSLDHMVEKSRDRNPERFYNRYLSHRSEMLEEHPSPWLHNPDLSTHLDVNHPSMEQIHRFTPDSLQVRAVANHQVPQTSQIIHNPSDNGEYHLYHPPAPQGLVIKAKWDLASVPNLGREPSVPEGHTALYRGDPVKFAGHSLDKTDTQSLFGRGIYLTDNKRIARDYTAKDNENVLYRGKGFATIAQAKADHIRKIAMGIDENGKRLGFGQYRDLNSINPEHGSTVQARLAHAASIHEGELSTHKWRKMTHGEMHLVPKGSGAISAYHVPNEWLSKTLNVEHEIPEDVLDHLVHVLHKHGDAETGRDAQDYVKQFSQEDGFNPSFRDVWTRIYRSSPLHTPEGHADFRKGMKELGYKGLSYEGGVTRGGLRHNAYSLWDEQGLHKRKAGFIKAIPVVIKAISPQPGSARTQTGGMTKNTYLKHMTVSPDFQNIPHGGSVLDYGAGEGIGTDLMRQHTLDSGKNLTVHSYEVHPDGARKRGHEPTFTSSDAIPHNAYNHVICSSVLNVLEPELRGHVTKDILSKIKPGGTGFITARDVSSVMATKRFTPHPTEPNSIYVHNSDGSKTFHHGFTKTELRDYVQGIGGDGYHVKVAPASHGYSGSVVEIRRNPSGAISKAFTDNNADPEEDPKYHYRRRGSYPAFYSGLAHYLDTHPSDGKNFIRPEDKYKIPPSELRDYLQKRGFSKDELDTHRIDDALTRDNDIKIDMGDGPEPDEPIFPDEIIDHVMRNNPTLDLAEYGGVNGKPALPTIHDMEWEDVGTPSHVMDKWGADFPKRGTAIHYPTGEPYAYMWEHPHNSVNSFDHENEDYDYDDEGTPVNREIPKNALVYYPEFNQFESHDDTDSADVDARSSLENAWEGRDFDYQDAPEGDPYHTEYHVKDGADNYFEHLITQPGLSPRFRHKHWPDDDNVIAHVRGSDREDHEGNKHLAVEEVQSDLHQRGRSYGYTQDDYQEKLRVAKEARDNHIINAPDFTKLYPQMDKDVTHNDHIVGTEHVNQFLKQELDLNKKYHNLKAGSPVGTNANFKGEKWHELALKHALVHALQNGHDYLSVAPPQIKNGGFEYEPKEAQSRYYGKIYPEYLNKMAKTFQTTTKKTPLLQVDSNSTSAGHISQYEPNEASSVHPLEFHSLHVAGIPDHIKEHILTHGLPMWNLPRFDPPARKVVIQKAVDESDYNTGSLFPEKYPNPGQYKDLTQSPGFKNWFGESHVRTPRTSTKQKIEDMPPTRVYHGTHADFDEFKPESMGTVSHTFGSYKTSRHGIFFSESPQHASGFATELGGSGARVIPAYLSVKKPVYLNHVDDNLRSELDGVGFNSKMLDQPGIHRWEHFDGDDGKHFVESLKKLGYDGAHFEDPEYDEDGGIVDYHPTWVAFHPNQVKSAIGNRGDFSKETNKLTKATPIVIQKAKRSLEKALTPEVAKQYHDEVSRELLQDHGGFEANENPPVGSYWMNRRGLMLGPFGINSGKGALSHTEAISNAMGKAKVPGYENHSYGVDTERSPESIDGHRMGFARISLGPYFVGAQHDEVHMTSGQKSAIRQLNRPPRVAHMDNVDTSHEHGSRGKYRYTPFAGLEDISKSYIESLRRAESQTNTNPTEAQKVAGNARKGKFQWKGLTITIENPKGSIRRGKNPKFPWEIKLGCAYGYFNSQPLGKDGDPVDVFVCEDNLDSDIVFVVNQVDQAGKFDEHKAIIGCTNEKDARKAYLSCYSPGWVCGEIKAITVEDFKKWLESGRRGVLKGMVDDSIHDAISHKLLERNGGYEAKENPPDGAYWVNKRGLMLGPFENSHSEEFHHATRSAGQLGYRIQDPVIDRMNSPQIMDAHKHGFMRAYIDKRELSFQHDKNNMTSAQLSVIRRLSRERPTHVRTDDFDSIAPQGVHGVRRRGNLVEPGELVKAIDPEHPLTQWAEQAKQHYGLTSLQAYPTSHDDWKLHNLIVPKESRGQGIGTSVLTELTNLADKHGVRVILSPGLQDDRHGTTSRGRLVKFYKRFGFVENKNRNKDFRISEGMYRDPKARPVIIKSVESESHMLFIHGGSDFDKPDPKFIGSGERYYNGKGGIMGGGHYGYVLPNTSSAILPAIQSAKRYARRYGKGDTKVHIYKLDMNGAKVAFRGDNIPELSNFGEVSHLHPYQFDPTSHDLAVEDIFGTTDPDTHKTNRDLYESVVRPHAYNRLTRLFSHNSDAPDEEIRAAVMKHFSGYPK